MSKDTTTNSQRPKTRYKITNWPAYNQALKQRAKISPWLPPNFAQLWYQNPTASSPIGQTTYSDMAIEFCLTLRQLYQLPYRQTQGLVEDLFAYLACGLSVPSYSQLQRRAAELSPNPVAQTHTRPMQVHIVIDSTGLKVSGEGDGAARAVEGTPAWEGQKPPMA